MELAHVSFTRKPVLDRHQATRWIGHKLLQAAPLTLLLNASTPIGILTGLAAGIGCICQPRCLSERSWKLLTPYLLNGCTLTCTLKACQIFFALFLPGPGTLPAFLLGAGYIATAIATSILADRLNYPYPRISLAASRVILAGSYNPPTLGHMNLLERLHESFSEVFAVIACNPNKTYQVSQVQRKRLLEKAIENNPKLARVRVIVHSGYLFDLAHAESIQHLARGVRNFSDWWSERLLQVLNFLSAPDLTTHLMSSLPEFKSLSSSSVRDKVANGSTIRGMVPLYIESEVYTLYTNRD